MPNTSCRARPYTSPLFLPYPNPLNPSFRQHASQTMDILTVPIVIVIATTADATITANATATTADATATIAIVIQKEDTAQINEHRRKHVKPTIKHSSSYQIRKNKMTVVLGILTQEGLTFASDGYALFQKDAASLISKDDFYSKVSIIGNGKYIIGSAGSHELAFHINDHIEASHLNLSETGFLNSLKQQIYSLNSDDDEKKTTIIVGYIKNEQPQLYLFDPTGRFYKENRIVAIGSGADEAINWLSSCYSEKWKLPDAIGHVVEAVYQASSCPTVNFVPMVGCLTSKGYRDFSDITISMFKAFKYELKTKLSSQGLINPP